MSRGGMGRQLVALPHAGTHVEEMQGVIRSPAPEAGPSSSSKMVTFHRHFCYCACLVVVLLVHQAAAAPSWPFYKKVLLTVSLL